MIGRSARNGLVVRLARLWRARGDFDRAVSANIEALTWEEAALLLRHVRHEIDLLGSVAHHIEARIIAGRKADDIWQDVPVEGVGVVAVHRTKDRKSWDHAALAAAVIDEHLHDTGEMPTPWEVRDWLMDAAGIAYWRSGALKAIGLDPDNYCEVSRGRTRVDIIGGPDL